MNQMQHMATVILRLFMHSKGTMWTPEELQQIDAQQNVFPRSLNEICSSIQTNCCPRQKHQPMSAPAVEGRQKLRRTQKAGKPFILEGKIGLPSGPHLAAALCRNITWCAMLYVWLASYTP